MTEHQPGSREWAEAEARKGAKVRRSTWEPDEWLTFIGDQIVDESGCHLGRKFDFAKTGWSIYEPAPAQAPDLAAREAMQERLRSAAQEVAKQPSGRQEQMRAVFSRFSPDTPKTEGARPLSLGDVLDRLAELARRFEAHSHRIDVDPFYAGGPTLAYQDAEPAPTFTTSRKSDPEPVVMTNAQIIDAAIKLSVDGVPEAATVIRLTRASIRAQLAANEAEAVKEGVELIERSITPLEKAIAAALRAHKEGV